MSSTKKWLRRCVEVAKESGVESVTVEQGGKHIKLICAVGARSFVKSVSRTEGDPRLLFNIRSDLRRMVQQATASTQ